jgi:hypothetical protein
VPLAIHFQSRLLAEFAVLAVFCALGTLQTLLPSLPPPQAWMLPCPLCARALSLPLSLLLSLSLSLSLSLPLCDLLRLASSGRLRRMDFSSVPHDRLCK